MEGVHAELGKVVELVAEILEIAGEFVHVEFVDFCPLPPVVRFHTALLTEYTVSLLHEQSCAKLPA